MAPPQLPSAAMTALKEEGRAPTRARTSPVGSGATAAEGFTDDILVEILSRVPAKSLCRFKCVSPHWLGLIEDPQNRKRLPQTLAGFFHSADDRSKSKEPRFLGSPVQFTNLGGTHRRPPLDAAFAFLPGRQRLDLLDSCNGLLLFRWYLNGVSPGGGRRLDNEFRYLVCNPATEKWAALPDSHQAGPMGFIRARFPRQQAARLGFDSAVSPHFHVFQIQDEEEDILACILGKQNAVYSSETRASVYSSETGGWVHKQKTWEHGLTSLPKRQSSTVFLHGKLHFQAYDHQISDFCLVAVDMEAETWTNFALPRPGMLEGFVQVSQGRLHYANLQGDGKGLDGVGDRLAIYVLQDYEKKEWVLKHSIDTFDLAENIYSVFAGGFHWVAIHPQCNVIYFTVGRESSFICYDMDRRRVKVIRDLVGYKKPYLPYVPLYAELPSLPMM